ncbi:MAG: hypothetical protein KTR35_20400 [Gammaproteobacteria bacterium]|nr:hypothetical protein [Gammaproteobacteria bacterium]
MIAIPVSAIMMEIQVARRTGSVRTNQLKFIDEGRFNCIGIAIGHYEVEIFDGSMTLANHFRYRIAGRDGAEAIDTSVKAASRGKHAFLAQQFI